MRSSHLISLVLAVFLISLVPLARAAQENKKQTQDSIKLSAELVQIDVLVTDKAGKTVVGLKRDDFELYDNNKRQLITHFAFEEPVSRGNEAQATQAQIPKSLTDRDLKRVIAFVVDTLHMHFEDLYQTRKMLEDFVDRQMQPGDLVLMISTAGGSGLLQQFTSDRLLLHRAIDRLTLANIESGTIAYRSITKDIPWKSMGGQEQPVDSPKRGSGRLSMPDVAGSHEADPLEEADVRDTLETLKTVVGSMRGFAGRKLGVFVSQGFRLFPTSILRSLFDDAMAYAARANVVIYSIDPRGLVSPITAMGPNGPTLGNRDPFGQSIAQQLAFESLDAQATRESLAAIAYETGGELFANSNDITRSLTKALDQSSSYYMLGFQPETARWDGKMHKIKVVVKNRPDLTIHARKNYLAKSESKTPSSDDPKVAEILDAINSPLARRDIDLRLTALYIDNPLREPNVTLLLHIDASKLHFVESEGVYNSTLEQVGFVLDARGQKVDEFSNRLELKLQPQTYKAGLKQGFLATSAMKLKPGTYQMRLLIREVGFGAIGTANDFIEIPDFKNQQRLSASSIFIAGQKPSESKTVSVGATPAQRRFPQNGEFSYSLVIYNARLDEKIKQPQLEMQTRILRGSKVVFSGQSRAVTAGEGSIAGFRTVTGGVIKPLALAPGDYTFEIIVWDKLRKKGAVVRRETDFSVD